MVNMYKIQPPHSLLNRTFRLEIMWINLQEKSGSLKMDKSLGKSFKTILIRVTMFIWWYICPLQVKNVRSLIYSKEKSHNRLFKCFKRNLILLKQKISSSKIKLQSLPPLLRTCNKRGRTLPTKLMNLKSLIRSCLISRSSKVVELLSQRRNLTLHSSF